MTDFVPSDLQADAIARDPRLVHHPHPRAAGVPGVRLCRLRQDHDHPPRHRRSRPRHHGARCRRRHGLRHRRRALRRVHRQGGAGDEPQGHARLDHPQPDLPGVGGDPGRDRAGQGGDRRPRGGAARPRHRRADHGGSPAAQPAAAAGRHPQAALRPQRAVDRPRRGPDRARRGLDGRRGDGARSPGLRQADPGAGRSGAAAADQGRGCVHPRRARRDADRDPPPGRRECDHPARHPGPPGPTDRLWRARPARLEAAALVDRARAAAQGRAGDLRPQRHPDPAQPRHEAGRRVRGALPHPARCAPACPRRSSA